MNRRPAYIATAVIIAAVVAVGLGARKDEQVDPMAEFCSDIDDVFEMCAPGQPACECERVSDEFGKACQAGCVLKYCPGEIGCTGKDPLWCASCTDVRGAAFWTAAQVAESRCNHRLHNGYARVDPAEFADCLTEEVEQGCPGLKGTDWYSQYRTAIKPVAHR